VRKKKKSKESKKKKKKREPRATFFFLCFFFISVLFVSSFFSTKPILAYPNRVIVWWISGLMTTYSFLQINLLLEEITISLIQKTIDGSTNRPIDDFYQVTSTR
jgi:hypothetical protein